MLTTTMKAVKGCKLTAIKAAVKTNKLLDGKNYVLKTRFVCLFLGSFYCLLKAIIWRFTNTRHYNKKKEMLESEEFPKCSFFYGKFSWLILYSRHKYLNYTLTLSRPTICKYILIYLFNIFIYVLRNNNLSWKSWSCIIKCVVLKASFDLIIWNMNLKAAFKPPKFCRNLVAAI